MAQTEQLNDLYDQAEGDFSQSAVRIARLMIRRRWVIIGSACTIALSTIGVLWQLPNEYTSEATILVDAQKVSERYVVPTTSSDVGQALEAMEHEVLSRPRLLAIIDELGLYRKEKERLAPEQLIALMREHFSIEPFARPGQNMPNAFRISFIASTPTLAQQVTSRLTALFIEQNLKTRSEQATTTTTFLHEQLELAKKDLTLQEERLRDFKMQYLGELPEQREGNVAILTGLETQMSNVMSNRNQAQQQRLYLQSLLNGQRRRELSRLEAERRALLTTYTAQHPAVLKKNQEINRQQTLVDDLKTAKVVSQLSHDRLGDNIADREEEAQITNQLQTNALEIDNLTHKEHKLRADIDQYRNRLNLTPVREQQLTSLQRDYDLLRQHYGDLLKKEQESQLATNLEKRQEGQQFRLADPPNLPTRPSSPKRLKLSLGALIAGLAVSCALAFLAEMKTASFHNETEAIRLALPIVIGIPLFLTPAEKRKRGVTRNLEWCAGFVVLSAVVAAEYYVYRHG